MVENDENNNADRFDVNSKSLLIFAGPTYFSYLLFEVLKVSYIASVVAGFSLFIAGLLLMLFLIRKKIIT